MNRLPPALHIDSSGIVIFPESACAVCVDSGRLLVIRQSRVRGQSSLELPGGKIEPDEGPVECALRELTEESGYTGTRGDVLIKLDLDLSVSYHRTYLIAVKGPYSQNKTGSFEPVWIKIQDGLDAVARGEITHAQTVVGLLTAAREHGTRDGY
jgi:ADP-ribose pyrophosphatase